MNDSASAQTRLQCERERVTESVDTREVRLQRCRQGIAAMSPGCKQATLWQERGRATTRRAPTWLSPVTSFTLAPQSSAFTLKVSYNFDHGYAPLENFLDCSMRTVAACIAERTTMQPSSCPHTSRPNDTR